MTILRLWDLPRLAEDFGESGGRRLGLKNQFLWLKVISIYRKCLLSESVHHMSMEIKNSLFSCKTNRYFSFASRCGFHSTAFDVREI